MQIANKEIHAAIFDLDGTLIDSCNVWKIVDQNFFAARNMQIPQDYTKKIAHIGLKEAALFTKAEYGIAESVEDILKEWQNLAMNEYKNNIKLKPYAKELLFKLKQNNIKLAIATASDKKLYEPCLRRLGIYDLFDFIGDVDCVNEGKNSAKLYLLVANKLKEKPENILVFEDIHIGLKTAYENGFISIGVYDENSKSDDNLKKKYSYRFIHDFSELL